MIKDTHKLQGFEKVKFPKLHGHIKIKTWNPLSGNVAQEVEGDNIITNAVRDIFANNYMGAIDGSKLLPIWQTWYGGVLCYEYPHATVEGQLDPDDYFPLADSDNHLVAHAGQTAIDPTHDDDMTRGNPDTSSYVATANSMKQVWEWGTTHGNGTISALSLTHKDTGSYGLGSTSYDFQNYFYPLDAIQSAALTSVRTGFQVDDNNLFAQYDDYHGLGFHIGEATDFYDGHGTFATENFTIYIRRFPYVKAGLLETFDAIKTHTYSVSPLEATKTIELPFMVYCQPAFYFDYETKYLWIFSNILGIGRSGGKDVTNEYSGTTVNYAVIDCTLQSNNTISGTIIESGVIVSDTDVLAPICMGINRSGDSFGTCIGVVKDADDYVYLPTTSGNINWGGNSYTLNLNINGYKKIKITSQSDQAFIPFDTTTNGYFSSIKGGGIIIEASRVCNGNQGYTCKSTLPIYTSYLSPVVWYFQSPTKVSSLALPVVQQSSYVSGTSTNSVQNRYILANKMVNTTKYNLSSAITKTGAQAMSIEYTLTEVPDEEEEEE